MVCVAVSVLTSIAAMCVREGLLNTDGGKKEEDELMKDFSSDSDDNLDVED